MQKRPKISIIVPMYNAEKYIDKCLDSILNQTEKEFEVIIIDDGSKDNSLKKCRMYEEKDYRVKVFHQRNTGVSKARNEGIKFCRGEYLTFIDIDDHVDKKYLTKLLQKQKMYNADFVCSGYIIEKKYLRRSEVKYEERIIENEDINLEFLEFFKTIANAPWGKLYKTDIIKRFNIFFPEEIPYGEDTIFNIEYYTYVKKIVIMSETLYFYNCKNSESAMKKYYPDMNFYLQQIFLAQKQFFEKKKREVIFEKVSDAQKQFYFEWCMEHYIERCESCEELLDKLKQTKERFELSYKEDNCWKYQQLVQEENWEQLILLWKKENWIKYLMSRFLK